MAQQRFGEYGCTSSPVSEVMRTIQVAADPAIRVKFADLSEYGYGVASLKSWFSCQENVLQILDQGPLSTPPSPRIAMPCETLRTRTRLAQEYETEKVCHVPLLLYGPTFEMMRVVGSLDCKIATSFYAGKHEFSLPCREHESHVYRSFYFFNTRLYGAPRPTSEAAHLTS